MKTVKHQLEARKFTIPDEEPMDDDVHLILIDQETDLSKLQFQLDPTDPTSSEILPNNVRPQLLQIKKYHRLRHIPTQMRKEIKLS